MTPRKATDIDPTSTEPRQLKVLLTEAEIGERRRDMRTSAEAADALELKLEPGVQMLNSLKAKTKALSHAVHNGFEFREEICHKEVDEEKNIVNYYDRGGQLVDSRPIRPGDLQEKLV